MSRRSRTSASEEPAGPAQSVFFAWDISLAMQATVVGRIASTLVLAVVVPPAIACIGLPLSLMLFPQSTAVGIFAALFYSPFVSVPIAVLLGFPTLLGLAKFWHLGLLECALAGGACAIPGVYLVFNLMTPGMPGAPGLGKLPDSELALIAAAGAVYGSVFWAMYWVPAGHRHVIPSERQ
jgi:hypothetical protein